MSYSLEFIQSPNYTPGSQTQYFYGRPRVIEFGAGHWWNRPEAGATHDGVVNLFLNPARQASANAVLSAGRVTEMVHDWDTSWATNQANPYTYSIEVDPRIVWGGELGEQIMATLAEYIADKGYAFLEWLPHKNWWSTECNPIDWGEVMRRARLVWEQKYGTPDWKKNLQTFEPYRLRAKSGGVRLSNLNDGNTIKTFPAGTEFDIKGKTTALGGEIWLMTPYSVDNGQPNGMRHWELEPIPAPVAEWIQNLRDIAPVKLMVLPAQTNIVNLNDGSIIKNLGQGTWIDFTKMTTVGGVEYLISSYSATNAMPNGIPKADVGIPAPAPEPTPEPVNEKPEWLANWQDIEDAVMFTRCDTDLVDLLDGHTIKSIPLGTEVEIASATTWHGQKYLITKYSTEKQVAAGIRLDDLDMKPVDSNPAPVPEDPAQPVDDLIKENNSLLKTILAILEKIWATLTGKA